MPSRQIHIMRSIARVESGEVRAFFAEKQRASAARRLRPAAAEGQRDATDYLRAENRLLFEICFVFLRFGIGT